MSLRLTLRELEVFVAVADAGSVTAAAQAIGLTQSAASQSLAGLEQSLSGTLFDRPAKRLLLNERGRRLLPQARALLDQAQVLQNSFSLDAAVHWRLGASTTIGNYILPGPLAYWRQHHPQTRIDLKVGNTADIVQAVATFAVDAGYIEGFRHHPDLLVEPWMRDRLVLFAAPGHALAQRRLHSADLRKAPWVLREQGSGTREEVERLLLPRLGALDDVRELGQSEAILGVVAAGGGISCLSHRVVAQALRQKQVVELETTLPPLFRTLYRVQHRYKQVDAALARFENLGLSPDPEEASAPVKTRKRLKEKSSWKNPHEN